jgi:hypothetical protein
MQHYYLISRDIGVRRIINTPEFSYKLKEGVWLSMLVISNEILYSFLWCQIKSHKQGA